AFSCHRGKQGVLCSKEQFQGLSMFFTLLVITFSLSVAVSYTAARVFRKPIGNIFNRIIQDDISSAWQRYVMFATYVVGISGGVRIYEIERYISPQIQGLDILSLTTE